jgi:hypothetical protein
MWLKSVAIMACGSEFRQACSNGMETQLFSVTKIPHSFRDGRDVRMATVPGVVKIIKLTIVIFLKDAKICWHDRAQAAALAISPSLTKTRLVFLEVCGSFVW